MDVVKYLLKDAKCNAKIRDVVSEAPYADLTRSCIDHLVSYLLACFPPTIRMDVTCSSFVHGVAT